MDSTVTDLQFESTTPVMGTRVTGDQFLITILDAGGCFALTVRQATELRDALNEFLLG